MLTVLCDICLLVPLTIWVGGITVLLFLIAPTIFRYLPNRTQSGNLVGMIFHHLEILHFGVIGLLILSETLKFVSTGSLISYKEMFISCLLGCFLVILLLAFTFINHKIQSVRAQIVSFDAMEKHNPLYKIFTFWHGMLIMSMVLSILLGGSVLILRFIV